MKISVLGIDIAKTEFYFCGLNQSGKVVFKKRANRREVPELVVQSGADLVVLEACGGAHHWGRTFKNLGVNVKLIAPHFVKPFVKSNKTDAADAEAIAEAGSRPTMRFVPIKSIHQQDIQSMHKVRERIIKQRTAVSNEIRGFLQEYGVVINQGFSSLRKFFLLLREQGEQLGLSEQIQPVLLRMYDEFKRADDEIGYYDRQLLRVAKTHPEAARIMTVPGIGPICATAIIASVGDSYDFQNGRQFAAWLGLTPREHSSGGKRRLLGISKRGNSYLRKQLVHGARSVVYYAKAKDDPKSNWINTLQKRAGTKKTTVACANKIARTAWAIPKSGESYRPTFATI